jgi:tetratricopeptide (TPR) repeat protein
MEAYFSDELQLLGNALRTPSFRFIVVAHNRRSVYLDIKDWLIERLGDSRNIKEFSVSNKDSTAIRDTIHQFKKGILLIPDLDFLLRDENAAQCIYFNQRRDAFARLDIAFICFIQPSNFQKVANKLPDWWSLRSLELEFIRATNDTILDTQFIQEGDSFPSSSLSVEEKKEEIESLYRQIEQTDPINKLLLQTLYYQLGELYIFQAEYDKALEVCQKSLELSLSIGNKQAEGITLNNIGHIYHAKGDYGAALNYFDQSLNIQQRINDRRGEATTLNNLAVIASSIGDDAAALRYLEQSLSITQQTKTKESEGRALNNISQIYHQRGDYDTALHYLERSLSIREQTGDRRGEAVTLHNISRIYSARGDYDIALRYLEQSLNLKQQIGDKAGLAMTLSNMGAIYLVQKQDVVKGITLIVKSFQIFEQIGSPNIKYPERYLSAIKDAIGETRFKEIVAAIQDNKQGVSMRILLQ